MAKNGGQEKSVRSVRSVRSEGSHKNHTEAKAQLKSESADSLASAAVGDFSKQHENLHKQIVAFEKLLQHAMNRFSREKLFNMLKLLSKGMVEKQQLEESNALHIRSVKHLKTTIQELKESHVGKKVVRENEKQLVQYFLTFFEDLEYLNELKRYFDEKIYIYLYEYFYDPVDDAIGAHFIVTSQGQVIEKESPTPNAENGNSESHDSNNKTGEKLPTKTEEAEEEIVFDFLSKQAKLSLAVQQMYKVNTKWGLILDESNPHLGAYDPDSKHELVAFSGSSRYEPILRLLPDIFVKAYKSIEMAKLWWHQAARLYSGKPVKRITVKELAKEEVEMEHKIEKISEDINRFEATISVRSEDLAKLSERENRFQALSDQCEKLEDRKDTATQAYNTILAQVKSMNEELELYQKGSKKYTELEKRLKETDKQLALTQDELKILAYHFHIVQEDYNLERELQPHLIRFRADIEGKMSEIEDELRIKHTQKHETEKRLVLLKANCERMHEIMQRYNDDGNSRSTTPTRENTDQAVGEKFSAQTRNVEKDQKRNLQTSKPNQTGKINVKEDKTSTTRNNKSVLNQQTRTTLRSIKPKQT